MRQDNEERERRLMEQIATRDKVAFERFYSLFYPRLKRYLSRLLRRPDLVEEVLNDTLLVVWEKAATFEGRSKVSTWVTGIAYLKGIKALERLKSMPEQLAAEESDLEQLEESDDLIRKLGLHDWIGTGLANISPEQRSVVELTYVHGYSYIEIAEIMGCPVNTVKTRMFHARRKLELLLPELAEATGTAERVSDRAQPMPARDHRGD